MTWLGTIGSVTLAKWRDVRYLLAVAWSALQVAARAGTWRRTVRNVLARQILFTGYDATRFVSFIAFMVGVSIVVQTQVWLTAVGQGHLLGPVLVAVVIREVGPLLTNFVVIGRSGTAIATELGNMKVNGEVHLLDAQGLDPFIYLVVPRVLGVAISVFCLTIIFVGVSLLSGYLSGVLLGATDMEPMRFVDTVFGALTKADVFNLLVKTFVPGILTGVTCCTEGLSVGAATTEVPQAATRGVVRSISALFVTSLLVSLVTYL
ncbi:MAG: ABC transporter permease [Lentisphaerae bacterium]|nr:ABC transporter permease [Lentisphaerota bacterium]